MPSGVETNQIMPIEDPAGADQRLPEELLSRIRELVMQVIAEAGVDEEVRKTIEDRRKSGRSEDDEDLAVPAAGIVDVSQRIDQAVDGLTGKNPDHIAAGVLQNDLMDVHGKSGKYTAGMVICNAYIELASDGNRKYAREMFVDSKSMLEMTKGEDTEKMAKIIDEIIGLLPAEE